MGIHNASHGESKAKETIIYTTQDRVGCSGENNDHPLVYYSVPKKGYVTCGYCDIKYAHREKEE